MMRAQDAAHRAAGLLRTPLLMLQAEADPIISAAHNRRVFDRLPVADKRWMSYPAAEHNVIHKYNPRQAEVFAEIDRFLGRAR
jgi:alpha-beta hydrolase superfamily lysophospholipase